MNLFKITCWLHTEHGPELHTGYAFAPRDCDELGPSDGRFFVCKFHRNEHYWVIYDRMSGYELGSRFCRKTRKEAVKCFCDWRFSSEGDWWDELIKEDSYKKLCDDFYHACLHVEEVSASV